MKNLETIWPYFLCNNLLRIQEFYFYYCISNDQVLPIISTRRIINRDKYFKILMKNKNLVEIQTRLPNFLISQNTVNLFFFFGSKLDTLSLKTIINSTWSLKNVALAQGTAMQHKQRATSKA